jgi:hypothetical protein
MSDSYAITGSSPLPTGARLIAVGCFTGMAVLCLFELLILIPKRFQRRSGQYFWSLVTALIGAALFNIGIILYNFVLHNTSPWIYVLFLDVGYLLYVPSEMSVLYSRLHLLSPSRKLMQVFLLIAVTEVTLVTIPLTVISTGAQVTSSAGFATAFSVFARVEVIVYAATQWLLSGIYIFQVSKMWKSDASLKVKKLLRHLVLTNMFVILLQLVYVVLEFKGESSLGASWVVCKIIPYMITYHLLLTSSVSSTPSN